MVQQQILRLQITVDDAELVDVLDAGKDLSVHLASLRLFQSAVLHDVLEELAARTILHY